MKNIIDSKNYKYQSCSNNIRETWETTFSRVERDFIIRKIIDVPQFLGVCGGNLWFIPRFTADKDQTTDAFFGLMG